MGLDPGRASGGRGTGHVVADCDLAQARNKAWNERNDVFRDRRPDLYRLDEPASIA
jgi:hypothetical protein